MIKLYLTLQRIYIVYTFILSSSPILETYRKKQIFTQETDCFCALAPRIETKQRPKKFFIWWSVCLEYWKPCINWAVVLYTCNPSPWEVESGGAKASSRSQLPWIRSWATWDFVSGTKARIKKNNQIKMSFCLSCAQRRLTSTHTTGQFPQLKFMLFLKPNSDIQANVQVFWSWEVWTQMHHLFWTLWTKYQASILCLWFNSSGFTVSQDLLEHQAQTHGQVHLCPLCVLRALKHRSCFRDLFN